MVNKLALDINSNLASYYTDALTGKRSRNMVKEKREYNAQNVKTYDFMFQYQLDNEGYPLNYTAHELLTNSQSGQSFEYNK
jgi:hypothetical protein